MDIKKIKKILVNIGVYPICLSIYLRIRKIRTNISDELELRRKTKVKKYTIDSIRHYCESNGIQRIIFENSRARTVDIPHIWGEEFSERKEIEVSPDIYYAKLNNIVIIGSGNHILHEDFCLNDRIELLRAPYYAFDRYPCIGFNLEKRRAAFRIDKNYEHIDEGISLVGECSENWYHWLMDCLGKIIYINQLEELDEVPLIIDKSVTSKKTYMEALRLFDRKKHPIIEVDRNKPYQIKVYHYFSPCTFGNPFEKEHYCKKIKSLLWCVKNEKVLEYYHDMGVAYASDQPSPVGKKLYIDRHISATQQRLVNENEVMKLCIDYGFEPYNPSDYSFKQQIAAFRDADIIIGDEGAAFTNSVFSGNKTLFVVVVPTVWENYTFSTISIESGSRCCYLDANVVGSDREHEIDLEYLRSFLEKMKDR